MLYFSRMAKWTFEPGHTAAEFAVKHMMVTWVRGAFKDVHGTLDYDPADPANSSVEIEIDANKIWSGDEARDKHLRAADFFDVENHPKITFKSTAVEEAGDNKLEVIGDLTMRGITKEVVLDVTMNGTAETPWWEDGEDKGPKTRAGFVGTTKINRYDFKVSWSGDMPDGGAVVGDEVLITVDAEAVME